MISDSRLVPIAFIDVAYRLLLPPPLVSFCEGKDHAVAAALAPFLLILLKSGPTNNGETLLSFSRSLTERFLIFFLPPSLWAASKLSVQREAFVDPHILAHIPKRKQKKRHERSPLNYYQHIILYAGRRQMKKAMAAPPGCDRKDTTDLG